MLKRFTGFMGRFEAVAFGCIFAALAMTQAAVAGVPAVVASSQVKYATGGMTDPTKVVLDSIGDIFTVDSNKGDLFVVAPGSTTPLLLMSGLGGTLGVAVDSSNDVIVSGSYNGSVFFIPASGIASAIAGGSLGTTINLTYAYGFGALDGYYASFADVAVDQNGVVYIGVNYCYSCSTTHYAILSVKTQGTATTLSGIENTPGTSNLVLTGIAGSPNSMVTDKNGHLFYADGTHVYQVTTATNAVVTVGSGYSAPTGVSFDYAGNLYISDNNKQVLFEVPNENGALNFADQFAVSEPTNIYVGVGFDRAGNFYSADGYNANSIDKTTLGALNFGNVAVGSASGNASVVFTYNSAVIPASISLGGSTEFLTGYYTTCSTTTAPATFPANCQYQLSFKPASTGVRKGSLQFLSAAGKPLATAYLTGVGTGAALTFDPGTQSSQTALTAWKTPSAVALDGKSNIYVADSTANAVQVISSAGTATATIGSGLSSPQGVAVDQAGNVIIADTGNNRIVVVPNENGTLNTADQMVLISATATPAGAALKSPLGLAVGANGAIYIADSGNARVLRVNTDAGFGELSVTTVGSGYTTPAGVALDNANSVYVTDSSANKIFVTSQVTGLTSTALSGLNAPTAISIDASGSAYVVNTGSATVLRIPSVSGSLNPNTQLTLGSLSLLKTPSGVAVNGSGNVAIADSGVPGVFTLVRTTGALQFGSVDTSQSSISQTLTLTSAGTSSLTLGATPYTSAGATTSYAVTSATQSGCSGSLVLTIGGTCGYAAVFSPTATGPLTDTLTFSSNAVNATTLTATLTGTGTNLPQSTTTLSVSPAQTSTTPYYGQVVTVTATVTAGSASTHAPTGTVTFYVDGIAQLPSSVSNTSPYTAQYIFPALSLTASTHTMGANYNGDTNNSSSHATPLTLVIAREPSVTTATVFPTVDQPAGTPFSYTVTVSPAASGAPTGSVTMYAAGTTSPVVAGPYNLTGGSVTFSLPSPNPTGGIGTYNYQFAYSGDVNFLPSTSNTVSITVHPPDYTVVPPTTSYTVGVHGSVQVPITITGLSGYAGNVTVGAVNTATLVQTPACVGLPQYVTCTFSPGIEQLGNATNNNYPTTNPSGVMTLTLTASVPPATSVATGSMLWPGALAGLLALALSFKMRRSVLRTRLMSVLLLIVLGSLTLGVSGCGSGSATSADHYTTPTGTTTFTVTFSGTGLLGPLVPPAKNPPTYPNGNPDIVHTLNLTLTVQ